MLRNVILGHSNRNSAETQRLWELCLTRKRVAITPINRRFVLNKGMVALCIVAFRHCGRMSGSPQCSILPYHATVPNQQSQTARWMGINLGTEVLLGMHSCLTSVLYVRNAQLSLQMTVITTMCRYTFAWVQMISIPLTWASSGDLIGPGFPSPDKNRNPLVPYLIGWDPVESVARAIFQGWIL